MVVTRCLSLISPMTAQPWAPRPLGPLQWNVMPMGVTNSNAAFKKMLGNLLERMRDCADPFDDDVMIASREPQHELQ